MRERPDSSHRLAARRVPFTIDLVAVTQRPDGLAVLGVRSTRGRGRDSWELPWGTTRGGELLEAAARRIARGLGVGDPSWMEQVGAFGDGRRHPGGSELSVCFVTVVAAGPAQRTRSGDLEWLDTGSLPDVGPHVGPRQRGMIDAALLALRTRMDYAPIPFRLLPPFFTLSELQRVYEVLLGRRLHKASFRRALHAAWLVEPTDEWRSEGRGRPAQLFRYAPRKRRGHRRAVRFDLL